MRDVLSGLVDELPDVFFRDLNGGVIVSEQIKHHPADPEQKLVILGEYTRSGAMGRQIILYHGSFMRVYARATPEQLKVALRDVLRHEFRHHLESLGGLADLEVEDRIKLRAYLDQQES